MLLFLSTRGRNPTPDPLFEMAYTAKGRIRLCLKPRLLSPESYAGGAAAGQGTCLGIRQSVPVVLLGNAHILEQLTPVWACAVGGKAMF